MLPLTTNIKEAYTNGRDDEQKFIQNLSLFLCTFLKEHGQLIESKVQYVRASTKIWLDEKNLSLCGNSKGE